MKRVMTAMIVMVWAVPCPIFAHILNVPGEFATIQAGIDASVNGDTVLVAPGTYIEIINVGGRAISLASLYMISGDTSYISSTIINASQAMGPVVSFSFDVYPRSIISGFTLRGGHDAVFGGGIFIYHAAPEINNCRMIGCQAGMGGGGVYCSRGLLRISDCEIVSCEALSRGGGLYCDSSYVYIDRCLIKENRAGDVPMIWTNSGGGICLVECYGGFIRQSIISRNISSNSTYQGTGSSFGGGLYLDGDSSISIDHNLICFNTASSTSAGDANSYGGGIYSAMYNTITNNTIVHNTAASNGDSTSEAYGGGFLGSAFFVNTIVWENSALEYPNLGGSPMVSYSCIQDGWEGEGNFAAYPNFCDPVDSNFSLAENSPCVGAGQNGVDIGAYGVGCGPQAISDEFGEHPALFGIAYNYPNPFNTRTTIRFSLPEAEHIVLNIYDILGRRIGTPFSGALPAGRHNLIWDAGESPSGIYFYRLTAEGRAISGKMTLLK